jgi:hypothetical protein
MNASVYARNARVRAARRHNLPVELYERCLATHKYCARCKTWLPRTTFWAAETHDGLHPYCKHCSRGRKQ